MNDFVANTVETPDPNTPFFISTAPAYNHGYVSFVAHVSSTQEPKSYEVAKEDSRWIDAMQTELDALERNKTWTLTSLPTGKKTIDSKWVYRIKYNVDGTVSKYKARLVAKGYNQRLGIDYHDNFSPVAKMVTIRLFLAIAAAKNWPVYQIDINNAYLHGHIEEELYLKPPKGYTKAAEGQVCRLTKSLYGLKQAGRQWNKELSTKLHSIGFAKSEADNCLFTKGKGEKYLGVLVYVDDLLIAGQDEKGIAEVKQILDEAFSVKDLGHARYFLGIEIARSKRGIFINQRKYIRDIIHDTGMHNAKGCNFPLPTGLKLSTEEGELLPDPERYRRLIGRLLYLNFTRPDISYSTQHLSQYMQQPRKPHLDAALHVVRYLKQYPNQGLFFSSTNNFSLQAYCDSDWASCPTTRRSLTGYCIFLGQSMISWKTKKQNTVSKSSAEAEYRSMSSTVCEIQWITYLLRDFAISPPLPVLLHCDNKAAEHIAANPVFHERTKHLDIDCHIVRNQVLNGFIKTKHVASKEQIADLLTKPLGTSAHHHLLFKMNHLQTTDSDSNHTQVAGLQANTETEGVSS